MRRRVSSCVVHKLLPQESLEGIDDLLTLRPEFQMVLAVALRVVVTSARELKQALSMSATLLTFSRIYDVFLMPA